MCTLICWILAPCALPCACWYHGLHTHAQIKMTEQPIYILRFSILQATESWAGPGNEANSCTPKGNLKELVLSEEWSRFIQKHKKTQEVHVPHQIVQPQCCHSNTCVVVQGSQSEMSMNFTFDIFLALYLNRSCKRPLLYKQESADITRIIWLVMWPLPRLHHHYIILLTAYSTFTPSRRARHRSLSHFNTEKKCEKSHSLALTLIATLHPNRSATRHCWRRCTALSLTHQHYTMYYKEQYAHQQSLHHDDVILAMVTWRTTQFITYP